jgi:hypothetical protein
MIMKYFLTLSLIAICFFPQQSLAQKTNVPGFLGKKLVLDLSGVVHPHITYNLISETGYNSNLRPTKDWWDFGFKGGIGYQVKPKLMVGFQFSYLKQSCIGPDYMYDATLGYSTQVFHEMLDYSSKSFALKGFSHGVSAGLTFNSIVDRNYNYRGQYDTQIVSGKFDQSVDIPKELSLAYTANMRQPISRNVAINYGLSYNINFMSGGFLSQIYSDYYNSVLEDLSRNRRFSIMTAHVGLSIIL